MSYNTDLTISNSCGHMIYLPALQVTEDLLSLLSANCNVLLEKLSCQIQFWCCETDLQRERLLNLHGHWVFFGCFFGVFCPTHPLVSFEPQSRTNPLTVSFPALPTVSSLCLPTLSHSAPGLAGGLCWWLWLPTCWNSQEWWRLGGELAGDRNSVRTAELAEPFREPQSGVTSPQSPALSAGEGDEIWTPFNIPPNNCVDKRHELPSAGMSWHLDN